MHLSAKKFRLLLGLLTFISISFPHWVSSRSLKEDFRENSVIITQIYISDPYLNELLIQGMEKGIQGDYEGAIALFSKILQFNPREVEAYYNRGIAYAKVKNYQAAIADFNQGLALNENIPDLYMERAKVYLQVGDRSAAIVDAKKAKELLRQQGQNSRYQEIESLLN